MLGRESFRVLACSEFGRSFCESLWTGSSVENLFRMLVCSSGSSAESLRGFVEWSSGSFVEDLFGMFACSPGNSAEIPASVCGP